MAGRWGQGCAPSCGSLSIFAFFPLDKTKILPHCFCWAQSAFPKAIIPLHEEGKYKDGWMDGWKNEWSFAPVQAPFLLKDGDMKPQRFTLPHPWVLAIRARRGRWSRMSPCLGAWARKNRWALIGIWIKLTDMNSISAAWHNFKWGVLTCMIVD